MLVKNFGDFRIALINSQPNIAFTLETHSNNEILMQVPLVWLITVTYLYQHQQHARKTSIE